MVSTPKKFFLQPIKDWPREFLLILAIATIGRLIALFLLPKSPSILAPDEGTYAYLADWVETGQTVNEFPAYGAGLYNSAKSIIIPSALFIRLNAEPLLAVRITSLLYGIFSIYMFGKLLLLVAGGLARLATPYQKRLGVTVFALYAFLPSNFIWSILGLRESASAFWIILSAYLLISISSTQLKLDFKTALLVYLPKLILTLISLVLSFGARRETSLVFLAFFCTIFLMFIRRNRLQISIICIFGFLGGHLFISPPSNQDNSLEISKPDGITLPTADRLTNSLNQSPLRKILTIETQRNVNTIDAATALPTTPCSADSGPVQNRIWCNLSELPFRLFSTLLRPMVWLDVGSTTSNLAAIENLLWLAIIIAFIASLLFNIKKRLSLSITLPTSTFIFCFASLMALYEGNLGTAFRHKSTILWPLLLVIYLAGISQKRSFYSREN